MRTSPKAVLLGGVVAKSKNRWGVERGRVGVMKLPSNSQLLCVFFYIIPQNSRIYASNDEMNLFVFILVEIIPH